MRIGLVKRGLLLVAFPVFCQLIFVAVLYLLLRDVEAGIEIQYRNRALADKITALTMRLSDDLTATDTFPKEELVRLDKEINDLIVQCAQFPRMQANLREINKLLKERVQEASTEPRRALSEANWQRFAAQETNKAYQTTAVLADKFMSIMNELQSETSDIELPKKTKIGILTTLILGAGVTIPAGLFLAHFYATSIREPVRRVMVNSSLLSQRAPLLPETGKNDEIGELDHLLHIVANSIEQVSLEEQAMLTDTACLVCSLTRDGRFVEANPYSFDMLGISADELCFAQLEDIIAPQMVLDVEQHLRELPQSGETKSFEVTLIHKSGRPVLSRWSAFWGPEERIFAVATDITAEKQADQMKTEFLTMIIQGLRTPLTSILSRSQQVSSLIPPSAAQELESIERNINKLLALTDQAIAYQSLSTAELVLTRTECRLGDIFRDVYQLLENVARSKEVTIQIPERTPMLHCDRQQIFQLVLNLVSNAIKFSPVGSSIDLSVKETNGTLEVHVTDQGSGVPDSLRDSIFEPFNQGRLQEQGGCGLGLATCKLIVEAHGGTIGVRSRSGTDGGATSGSDFWFTIPR